MLVLESLNSQMWRIPRLWPTTTVEGSTDLTSTGKGQNGGGGLVGNATCMCADRMLSTSFPGLFPPKTLEMPCKHSLHRSWACHS